MPLASMPDCIRGARDPDTNSQLEIKSTPDIATLVVKFESGSVALTTAIYIHPKFPDRPLANNDQTNPRVMISAGDLNRAFLVANMRDVERNTELVERIVRMIAFVNKTRPLALSPYLWSDYDKLRPETALYRMPSDQALLNTTLAA